MSAFKQNAWMFALSLILSFIAGIAIYIKFRMFLLILVAIMLAVFTGVFFMMKRSGWVYFGLPTIGLIAALAFGYVLQL